MNAVLILDKPQGLSSHDAVNRVRRILGERSVGHIGTLDPMATGVLPMVVGNLTRLAQFYLSCEKTYQGVIRLGFSTDTYDAEGEPLSPPREVDTTLDNLRQLAAGMLGIIEQTPPPFSAKKIRGVPAYNLARQHLPVALKPVQVEIKELEIQSLEADRITFRARVGSGTYIRSIAHDLGASLACGAHLASLRRTQVGDFNIAEAHTLGKLEAAGKSGTLQELFLHPRQLLSQFPCVTANVDAAARIRSGQTVNLPEMSQARVVKVFEGQKNLIAIATRIAGTLFHAKVVLGGGGMMEK